MSSTGVPDSVSSAIRSPLLALLPAGQAQRPSLVETLLRQQQDLTSLTAADRFSHAHDQLEAATVPAQAKYYRDLIPLERPKPGQQYAFEVDLDACTGCKACVAACHSLNGLEEAEVWRTVGLLHGGTPEAPTQQTVTTSCHHCVDPACMRGCPVQAYEKDAVTGIVKHLDDQCIGCQYCVLMCPYDVPKYSKAKGIVRKCDMCSDRLAQDEAPACVQGCPNQAIRIAVIDQSQAIEASQAGMFLPGAPAPDHTLPTTMYKSARPVPHNMLPADFYSTSPEHGHPPLVLMLVLTQVAVGAMATGWFARHVLGGDAPAGAAALPGTGLGHAVFTLVMALSALAAATFHLGRPLFAWRALLGLRTSWMSREILAFGLFAKVGVLYALSLAADSLPQFPGKAMLVALGPVWEAGAAAIGIGGVLCSAMIYVATRRAHWSAAPSIFKFFGTTVMCGAAAVAWLAVLGPADGGAGRTSLRGLLVVVLIAAVSKLGFEVAVLRHLRERQHTVWKRVALLMVRDLHNLTLARFLLGILGGVLLPAALLASLGPGVTIAGGTIVAVTAMFLFLVAGELLERHLFFKAAPASRMPGGLS